MTDKTLDKVYETLADSVEVHAMSESAFEVDGTVNVSPEEASKTRKLLEEAGCTVVSMEDLRETANTPGDAPGEPGELYTRINFQKSEELRES